MNDGVIIVRLLNENDVSAYRALRLEALQKFSQPPLVQL